MFNVKIKGASAGSLRQYYDGDGANGSAGKMIPLPNFVGHRVLRAPRYRGAGHLYRGSTCLILSIGGP
jgi:hypothetical protein